MKRKIIITESQANLIKEYESLNGSNYIVTPLNSFFIDKGSFLSNIEELKPIIPFIKDAVSLRASLNNSEIKWNIKISTNDNGFVLEYIPYSVYIDGNLEYEDENGDYQLKHFSLNNDDLKSYGINVIIKPTIEDENIFIKENSIDMNDPSIIIIS